MKVVPGPWLAGYFPCGYAIFMFFLALPGIAASSEESEFFLSDTSYALWLETSHDSTGIRDFYSEFTAYLDSGPGFRFA